jgi:hypothetical protein
MDGAEAARVTVDPHVIGRVGDDRRGTFLAPAGQGWQRWSSEDRYLDATN